MCRPSGILQHFIPLDFSNGILCDKEYGAGHI